MFAVTIYKEAFPMLNHLVPIDLCEYNHTSTYFLLCIILIIQLV